MSTTIASRDLQESAEESSSAGRYILATVILIAVLVAACALQALTAPSGAPAVTPYTACLGADGSLYGLGEGPYPAIPCNTGDGTVQATMIRDGGR